MTPAPASPTLSIGPYAIRPLSDGSFRLDAGAIFGVVPKALWGRHAEADEANTLALAIRPFLVRGEGRTVLLDAGIGGAWDEKRRRIFGIDRRTPLLEALSDAGLAPEEVDTVVLTHLHWDHMGGALVADDAGRLAPAFPRAVHYCAAREVAAARTRHARSASYRTDFVDALEASGRLRPVERGAEVAPGISMHVLGGHSDGSSVVTAIGGGRTAIFWDDLLPTRAHCRPAWGMALDLYPADAFRIREEWIARAADRGWISLLYHDPRDAWGRIVRDGNGFAWKPLDPGDLAG